MFRGGRMLSTVSDYYVPFKPEEVDVHEEAQHQGNHGQGSRLVGATAMDADHGGSLDDYRFFLFGARYVYAYLGFSVDTGQFVGFLNTPAHP